MQSYWKSFTQLFFPPLCSCCDAALLHQEEHLCTSCLYHLPFTDRDDLGANAIQQQLSGRLPIVTGMSCLRFTKSSLTQQLIHHLKYRNQPDIGVFMGNYLGSWIKQRPELPPFDLLVPIPLHRSKLKKRGYNQSLYFAKGLAEQLLLPVNRHDFIRRKPTPSQTSLLKTDRFANVEDVFHCKNEAVFAGKHVLLVDDVLTTGSTIIAAGIALQKQCTCQLSVAVIAHV